MTVGTYHRPVEANTVTRAEAQAGRNQARIALQQKAHRTYRRRVVRSFRRVAVLLVADIITIGVVMWVGSGVFSAGVAAEGTIGSWGGGAGAAVPFFLSLVIGLLVTGTYGQGIDRKNAWRIGLAVLFAATLMLWRDAWVLGFGETVGASITLGGIVLAWVCLTFGRIVVDRLVELFFTKDHHAERTIFVGDPEEPSAADLMTRLVEGGSIVSLGWIHPNGPDRPATLGDLSDLPTILQSHDVDAVMVCCRLSVLHFEQVVEFSTFAGCRVLAMSRLDGQGHVHPSLVWQRGVPLVQLTVPSLKLRQFALKRIIDVIGSIVGLVLFAPVFAFIALLIKLDSRGPVFFSHDRVGMGCRVFRMLKFRTMVANAEEKKEDVAHLNQSGDPRLFKIMNDPRVTRVGFWLRRWSLDELPQLINVLSGKMSLVGPRPFFESDLARYHDHHFARLNVKPGMTGQWQVAGRSCVVDFEEVVRLDRQYIDGWSVLLDLKILLLTVPAVLRRTGAY